LAAKPWRVSFGFSTVLSSNSPTPTNAQSWDYDAVGNWDSVTTNSTTQTRGANRQNEITSVSGATTPTYDSNGNLTKDENDYRFVWDAWNMMVQVKNSSNLVIVTYGRDALHRHVTDAVGSSVLDRFFSQDWQLLETRTGSNTVTRNVWSPAYVDAMVLRDRDTDSNGTLDERIYPLQDANWNTTGLVNSSGTVVERDTYGPYGGVTFRDASGSVISTSAKGWVFLHQGGEKIAAGDYEFRNRVLSPTLGRWLSNDPIGFSAGDVNTYRYLGNGPGNRLDPNGLQLENPIYRQPTIYPFWGGGVAPGPQKGKSTPGSPPRPGNSPPSPRNPPNPGTPPPSPGKVEIPKDQNKNGLFPPGRYPLPEPEILPGLYFPVLPGIGIRIGPGVPIPGDKKIDPPFFGGQIEIKTDYIYSMRNLFK
jgi:RHS repeat-associated protein